MVALVCFGDAPWEGVLWVLRGLHGCFEVCWVEVACECFFGEDDVDGLFGVAVECLYFGVGDVWV